jgi:hypothetical protein
LKFLFAEHISSVSLCHLSSLPQLSGGDEMFPQTIAGGIFDVGGPFEKKHNCCNHAIALGTPFKGQ